MKYIILVVLLVFAVLLIIAAVRAEKMKKKIIRRKPAISFTEEEEALYAQRLSEIVKVPTITAKQGEERDLTQFRKMQEIMRQQYPLVFSKLEYVDIDGSMLLRWPGKNPDKLGILLMGHQDVVPAEETEWKYDPFSGEIEGGCVHGRGAMDCKCTVMCEFSAIEELLAEGFEPECDVYLASSVDEELGGFGADATVAYLKEKGIRLAAVMDEGGAIVTNQLPGLSAPCATIGVVEKGTTHVKVIAHGDGGHSSTPPANTPIVRLSRFVAEVEKKKPFKKHMIEVVSRMFEDAAPYMTFPMRLIMGNLWLFKPLMMVVLPKVSKFGEAFLSTTCAFTMSGGSSAPNVLPDEAYVVCNLRPAVHQNREESIAVIKKYAKKHNLIVETPPGHSASNITDIDGKEFQFLKTCLNKAYPDCVVLPYYMTGGTDSRKYEAVCKNVLRFCPVRMTKQQLAAMHAANENIGMSAIADGVKFYKYYVQQRAGADYKAK